MEMGLDAGTLVMGLVVFLARVIDVTMGTMRTISIVQGRIWLAFFLGLVEVSMWLAVISTVIGQVSAKPVLGVFYALGFSTGSVVGILVERRLALGRMNVRVISLLKGREMAARLRELGFAVTTFQGEGMSGPVTMLYIVCQRREVNHVIGVVKDIEPQAFLTTDMAGAVGPGRYPSGQLPTGWRAVAKRK